MEALHWLGIFTSHFDQIAHLLAVKKVLRGSTLPSVFTETSTHKHCSPAKTAEEEFGVTVRNCVRETDEP